MTIAIRILLRTLLILGCLLGSRVWALALTDFEFTTLPSGHAQLALLFDAQPPSPQGYSIESPARITLDFAATRSQLERKYFHIGSGNTRSLAVVSTGDRTRVVLGLATLMPYATAVSGKTVRVVIGAGAEDILAGDAANTKIVPGLAAAPGKGPLLPLPENLAGGQVASLAALVAKDSSTIAKQPPVPAGLATLQSEPVIEAYSGEPLSLSFHDIKVRQALQQIADYVGLNLVASDSIEGSLTLRLDSVPWDQALDLVLRSQGLDKRLAGNVLLVAPAEELAERERQALQNRQEVEQLAPLITDFIQLNYAKAGDVLSILQAGPASAASATETAVTAGPGFLSARGSASIDARTNTLIVRDTADKMASVRRAVQRFDVPVRQVLIEARIVAARRSVGEQLGIRWGVHLSSGGSAPLVAAGTLEATSASASNQADEGSSEAVYPDALVVDLPVDHPAATSFAIGMAAYDYALDLELSALETRGSAEVVSQPKVVTSNGQEAFINSGQSIAFDGGEGGTTFVDAGLSLRVTPQITPDDRVVLDLVVTQDSLAAGGGAIDTNSVSTQVLVDNAETLVLGGVYRTETVTSVEKTPLLGDLPFVGTLFRRSSDAEEKTELLIFITPRLVQQNLAAN